MISELISKGHVSQNTALLMVYIYSRNESHWRQKKSLTKVVGNDPSYCSKFFSFCRNLKNERARAKKRGFIGHFLKLRKNQRFLALARSFLRFRQNKKNLEQ